MKTIFILIAALIFAFGGCKKDPIIDPVDSSGDTAVTPDDGKTPDAGKLSNTGTPVKGVVLFEFKDIDGNRYHAIQIGKQIWSQENLKTTHYNDGTPMPCIRGTSEWETMNSGAYCHYLNEVSNSEIYGLLYNNYAVTSNKLAPEGWHVATYEEWNTLLTEIGFDIHLFNANNNVGPLVDAKDWREPFYDFNNNRILCTNSTAFTALPNGYRDISLSQSLPEFDCLGVQAAWWASTPSTIIYLDGTFGIFPRNDRPNNVGAGIRLVKDAD